MDGVADTTTAPDGRPPAFDDARARRTDPVERRLSRVTGALLLLMITQAAFGYALAGLSVAPWVRDVHFALGIIVYGLTFGTVTIARRLPWGGRRERALTWTAYLLWLVATVVLALGLMARGWLPGYAPDQRVIHVGLGLVVMMLVVIVHIGAIFPSLLLSARREHEKSLAAMRSGHERAP